MSYLMYALDELKTVNHRLERLKEKESSMGKRQKDSIDEIIKDVRVSIEDIEKTESNLCADCEHDTYVYEHDTPPYNYCNCKECEYNGEELPLWYGDEKCPHFKKLDQSKEEYEG